MHETISDIFPIDQSMPEPCMGSSSDSESSSEGILRFSNLDPYGRPLSKPIFGSLEESSVLARAREFIPIFRNATMKLVDPEIHRPLQPSVTMPHMEESHDTECDECASTSSYGVQIDVGLGVFDVTGSVNENTLAQSGIPLVPIDIEGHSINPDQINGPLIRVISESESPCS